MRAPTSGSRRARARTVAGAGDVLEQNGAPVMSVGHGHLRRRVAGVRPHRGHGPVRHRPPTGRAVGDDQHRRDTTPYRNAHQHGQCRIGITRSQPGQQHRHRHHDRCEESRSSSGCGPIGLETRARRTRCLPGQRCTVHVTIGMRSVVPSPQGSRRRSCTSAVPWPHVSHSRRGSHHTTDEVGILEVRPA